MAKKNKGGRPLFDGRDEGEIVSKLEYAFRRGFTDLEACLHADISKNTLYRYIEKNPEFRDRKEMLKKQPNILAKEVVFEALEKDRNTQDAKWLLEHRASDEYSKQSKTDLTTKGEKIEQVVNITQLTSEELDDALRTRLSKGDTSE